MVPVTTDDLAFARRAVEAFDPPFPMPFDTSAATPKAWGRFNNFNTRLADAAVYIIDRSGRLVWSDLGEDYTHQVPAETIIAELSKLRQG